MSRTEHCVQTPRGVWVNLRLFTLAGWRARASRFRLFAEEILLEAVGNVMAHGDAWEEN